MRRKVKRVPVMALQKAVFSVLTQGQSCPVYDDVVPDARLPYISIGAITLKPDGSKDRSIYSASMQLHIWSDYQGKKEINEIMNDVSTVLSLIKLNTAEDGFSVVAQDIDFYEVFAEEQFGYHGVITLVTRIEDLED